jgi:hypothetical protein
VLSKGDDMHLKVAFAGAAHGTPRDTFLRFYQHTDAAAGQATPRGPPAAVLHVAASSSGSPAHI